MINFKKIVSIVFYLSSAYFFIHGVISIYQGSQMPESSGLGGWAKTGGGMILIGIGLIVLLVHFILKRTSIL